MVAASGLLLCLYYTVTRAGSVRTPFFLPIQLIIEGGSNGTDLPDRSNEVAASLVAWLLSVNGIQEEKKCLLDNLEKRCSAIRWRQIATGAKCVTRFLPGYAVPCSERNCGKAKDDRAGHQSLATSTLMGFRKMIERGINQFPRHKVPWHKFSPSQSPPSRPLYKVPL